MNHTRGNLTEAASLGSGRVFFIDAVIYQQVFKEIDMIIRDGGDMSLYLEDNQKKYLKEDRTENRATLLHLLPEHPDFQMDEIDQMDA